MTAVRTAAQMTIGVYIFANRVINLSILGFFSAAFSTASAIFDIIDSDAVADASTVTAPLRFMQPDVTSSPALTETGTGSPFIADVSIFVSPLIIFPSTAKLSPGFTLMTSPFSTLSEGLRTNSPSTSRSTSFTFRSAAADIALRLFSTAYFSNISPIVKNNTTPTASENSPSAKAPTVATVIRKFSSNILPFGTLRTVATIILAPRTRYEQP